MCLLQASGALQPLGLPLLDFALAPRLGVCYHLSQINGCDSGGWASLGVPVMGHLPGSRAGGNKGQGLLSFHTSLSLGVWH